MKNSWFLIFILPVLLSACSSTKVEAPLNNSPLIKTEATSCAIPLIATSSIATTSSKNVLPPVSQEEVKKTFTYEDEELGLKLKYPGSCYFNKGVFQCSDFTLSIWVLDGVAKPGSTPEKTFKDGQTQLKYIFINKNKIYAFLAWYDGENRVDLEKMIDKIAKSLSFTK